MTLPFARSAFVSHIWAIIALALTELVAILATSPSDATTLNRGLILIVITRMCGERFGLQ